MAGSYVRLRHHAARVIDFDESDVQHLDEAVGAQRDVGRLDVAVHEISSVRCSQPVGRLRHDANRIGHRDGTGDQTLRQRLTDNPFAGERAQTVSVDQLVDPRDVGMSQRNELADVVVEPGEAERIAWRRRGEDAERDESAAGYVARFPDFTESAFADSGFQFIRAKPAVRTKPHIDRPVARARA